MLPSRLHVFNNDDLVPLHTYLHIFAERKWDKISTEILHRLLSFMPEYILSGRYKVLKALLGQCFKNVLQSRKAKIEVFCQIK